MIIKLIRIKNDLLKKLRKFSKFKEILEIFEKFEKNWSNFKEIFWNVYIRLLYSNNLSNQLCFR